MVSRTPRAVKKDPRRVVSQFEISSTVSRGRRYPYHLGLNAFTMDLTTGARMRLPVGCTLGGTPVGRRAITDFLYARPSFIEGVARLLDFSGSLNEYNMASSPTKADFEALWMDWAVVGEDLRRAMKRYECLYLKK